MTPQDRTWLFEQAALDGADAAATLRYSKGRYRGAHPYAERMLEAPLLTQAARGLAIPWSASGGAGVLRLANADRALDHLVDYAIDGRANTLKLVTAAGITTLCVPPDTDPVIDTPAVVELIEDRAKKAARTMVLTVGAATQQLNGELLAEMAALKAAGCVGIGSPV